MVLEWFHLICYMPSDGSGELISKVRSNVIYISVLLFFYFNGMYYNDTIMLKFILPWIKSVTENHFELIVSCLVPFPPEFAKVGGIW